MANSKDAAGSWKGSPHKEAYRGTDASKPKPPVKDTVPVRVPVEPGADAGDLSGGEVNNGRVGG